MPPQIRDESTWNLKFSKNDNKRDWILHLNIEYHIQCIFVDLMSMVNKENLICDGWNSNVRPHENIKYQILH